VNQVYVTKELGKLHRMGLGMLMNKIFGTEDVEEGNFIGKRRWANKKWY